MNFGRVACFATISLSLMTAACGSDQRSAATAEDVREGEALPAAPPVPAEPASTSSPTAPSAPDSVVENSPPPEPPPAKELLTEAQIAKVSELVNTAEVEQGKIAQTKGKSANVKKFAAMMVKHHGDALKEQARLVKKLSLVPAESATATQLKADADKTMEELKNAGATEFDAAYAASQVEGHQKALDLLDTQLLPAAQTPEVVDALRQARGMVEQHLAEARALAPK